MSDNSKVGVHKMNDMLYSLKNAIADLIYPRKCALCVRPLQEEERGICRACYEGRGLILENFCQKCGKTIAENKSFCYDCNYQQHIFVQGHSLFSYDEIKSTIMAIKYQRARWRAVGLAELMAWLYEEVVYQWQIEAIAYVPQTYISLGEKGYNPPEVIAKVLAQSWHLPLIKGSLKAHHKWKSQKNLDNMERRENLKNVYYCKGPIPYQKIVLIDDVYTTGATVNACSLRLIENGAKQVYFLTLASGDFK